MAFQFVTDNDQQLLMHSFQCCETARFTGYQGHAGTDKFVRKCSPINPVPPLVRAYLSNENKSSPFILIHVFSHNFRKAWKYTTDKRGDYAEKYYENNKSNPTTRA